MYGKSLRFWAVHRRKAKIKELRQVDEETIILEYDGHSGGIRYDYHRRQLLYA